MSISTKHKELHAMNVDTPTSKKESLLEKPQDSLQEQENQLTSQSPSSIVKNVGTLIKNSFPKKFKNWTSFHHGLQDEIYDWKSGVLVTPFFFPIY